jgi:hypothetical protein
VVNEASTTSKLVTYRTTTIALVVVVLGLALLYFSGVKDSWVGKGSSQVLANQLGAILITTAGLTILWDLRGKKDILELVLEKVHVAADVKSSGLERVSMNWRDVPWDELFASAREVEVFISYGSTWRKSHWPSLLALAAVSRNKLWMYLPDPDHETTMKVLAQRYGYAVEKVEANVREMATEIASLARVGGADIRIYYRSGDPTFTCYRFDDRIVVTLYSNRRERSEVPTLLMKAGTFHEFFTTDLAAIRAQSRAIPLDQLTKAVS